MALEIATQVINIVLVTVTLLLVFIVILMAPVIKRKTTRYLLVFNTVAYITSVIIILSVITPHNLMHKIVMEELLTGYLVLYTVIYKLLTQPEENEIIAMRKLDKITPTLLALPAIQGVLIQSTNGTQLTVIYLGTILLSAIITLIIEQ